jgi:alpha-L-rhamnosidase
MLSRRQFCVSLSGAPLYFSGVVQAAGVVDDSSTPSDLVAGFLSPPNSARPYVLWMWMGCNISKGGITRDLEAMQTAGIGGATIFSLADTLTPWSGVIRNSQTPDIVAFSEPWWAMIHHACVEARRLGLELILHNCAGYESSGGTWITPDLSMQQLVWSEQRVQGGSQFSGNLKQPLVDMTPGNPFPKVYIPSLDRIEVPQVEAKRTYFRDIVALAVPAEGPVEKRHVIDLSSKMKASGEIAWNAPAGDWIVYRFGHTTTGAMIQPAQWAAMGLECDKMNSDAVTFHVQHVISEMKKHLGEYVGNPLTTFYCDSYEAGTPTWTPKMRQEFQSRRGYDLTPWLPVLAGRTMINDEETERFKQDMKRTIHDLYRDCYWAIPGPLANAAGLKFAAEPYEGPWEIDEVVKFLDLPTVEFWTTNNRFSPSDLEPVVKAAHANGNRLIGAESFTSAPEFAQWREHPAWLKPIGDAAFCAGVNRINVHHFVQQPWSENYQPGNAMGRWGIHLGRYQTWWKPGKAWITYLWRCQSLLQRGIYVAPTGLSAVSFTPETAGLEMRSTHRRDGNTDIYFVANVSTSEGIVHCSFPSSGKQPELWDPVAGTMSDLTDFEQTGDATRLPVQFASSQSYFILFSRPVLRNAVKRQDFPRFKTIAEVEGDWRLHFDPAWGGPAAVIFEALEDWTTRKEEGIKYYSGTAIYKKTITIPNLNSGKRVYLDLGAVKHIADVTLNGENLGVVWTAPWRIEITKSALAGENLLEIAVSNVWANRLIGDERQPPDMVWEQGDPELKGGSFLTQFPEWFRKDEKRPSAQRYAFTTWNYFSADSALEPSGLIGPVKLLSE